MAQARTQGGGFTAAHVWMIGFVFLWLVSTVLLVWLYTEQEAIVNERDTLRRENTKLVRGGDKGLPQYAQASENGASMAGLLEQARKEMMVLAVGEELADAAAARTKVDDELLKRIVGDKLVDDVAPYQTQQLLPAMKALYENFAGEHRQRRDAVARADAAEQQSAEMTRAHEEIRTALDAAADEVKKSIAELKAEHTAYIAGRDQQVDGFVKEMDDLRQEHSRDLQARKDEVEGERKRLEDLQVRYAELQAKLGELQVKPGERLTARREDGQVVLAVPGDEMVYIGLGQRHHLTTGLQFAVYPAEGIPIDGRAKGRVEVVKIHENTAACRIVGMARQEIIVRGDLVANPVYDRDRTLQFVVVGWFDADGDGVQDPTGGDRVKSLIAQWGGDVVDTLTSRVDFVVAGAAPPVPAAVAGTEARDRDAGDRDQARRAARDVFDATVASATNLSIPILTQDVFLQFLGFR
ncbi:MAG: hypothetical protein HOP29_02615 [Phycisphaerales bacterium]|nr:hypothetical protein [Phycisphaerales bacterium]